MVNAFRHGMDSQQLQQATSNPNIQRVLQKQASLNKRLSSASHLDQQAQAAAMASTTTRITIPEAAASSYSHTETAV